MKKCLTYFGAIAVVGAILCSCLHLRKVYIPEEVGINSEFEVRLVVDMRNPYNEAVFEDHDCKGYVGIHLPEGWEVDLESARYQFVGLDKADDSEGTLEFDEIYTQACYDYGEDFSKYRDPETGEVIVDKYTWTGLMTEKGTNKLLSSILMDSVIVTFKVKTNDAYLGKTLPVYVVINENGTDDGVKPEDIMFNKQSAAFECPSSEDGDPNSTEFSEEIVYVKVVEKTNSLEKVTDKQKAFTALPLPTGQLLITLADYASIGANAYVFDIQGKAVASQVLNQPVNTLDVNLSKGIYYVAVEKDGVRSSEAVVVK
ncbi:MAG: T9SS type A sorting domain-containing protein [Candidatus Azobacteroides sp.]|nr:T9SS type A sorting domain-containing protein [Candidatus Azobacteroides sp.]